MEMKNLSIVVVFLCLATLGFAQTTGPSGGTIPLPTIPQTSIDKSVVTPSPEALIYDGSVEAAEYRLGPGDVLQLRSWASNEASTVMISADNTLVIPRIGDFNIKGKTLAQVRELINAQTSRLFRKAGRDTAEHVFSLTLAQPRRIAVSVLGEVVTPGIYAFTGATRADIAVKVAIRQIRGRRSLPMRHAKKSWKRKSASRTA